jgi:hypothetical protein
MAINNGEVWISELTGAEVGDAEVLEVVRVGGERQRRGEDQRRRDRSKKHGQRRRHRRLLTGGLKLNGGLRRMLLLCSRTEQAEPLI